MATPAMAMPTMDMLPTLMPTTDTDTDMLTMVTTRGLLMLRLLMVMAMLPTLMPTMDMPVMPTMVMLPTPMPTMDMPTTDMPTTDMPTMVMLPTLMPTMDTAMDIITNLLSTVKS